MRASPSRSSSATRSSTAWIVAFGRPRSTTGQTALMKRASEVPPLVESAGRRPVTSSTAAATRSVNGPRVVRKASALLGSKVSAKRLPSAAVLTRRSISALRVSDRPGRVEADIEDEPHLARNDVRRRIADVDADDLEIRGIEVFCAMIERRRQEGGQYRRQRPDRIIRDVGIADVALAAVEDETAGQRAAPAVLDRVAERLDAGRLADDAMVEPLAPGERPVEKLDCAVDRRAFLVAGDKEADRARETGPWRRSPAPPRPPPRGRPSCRRRRVPRSGRRRPSPRTDRSASAEDRPAARRRYGRRKPGSARPRRSARRD